MIVVGDVLVMTPCVLLVDAEDITSGDPLPPQAATAAAATSTASQLGWCRIVLLPVDVERRHNCCEAFLISASPTGMPATDPPLGLG